MLRCGCCCTQPDGEEDSFPFAALDGASTSAAPRQRVRPPASIAELDLLRVVGRGTYGKVMLARSRADPAALYAVKAMRKSHLRERAHSRHALTERRVLARMAHHPFICTLHSTFQTRDRIYLALEWRAGGELFFHLRRERVFSLPRARLYAAEVLLAIEALHAQDIAYRDLKPENVLLDARGHACLSDFGLARECISALPGGARTCCGTPSYMAPEVLLGTGHGLAVDWWGFGTLLFEMLSGSPPFYSRELPTMCTCPTPHIHTATAPTPPSARS